MRMLSAFTVVASLASLLAGTAAAQQPPPVAGAAASPDPTRENGTTAADEARTRELKDRLFASQSLTLTPSGVTRDGIRMDDDSFYQLTGRTDLADRRHVRHLVKGTMISIGASALGLGITVRLFEAASACENQVQPCSPQHSTWSAVAVWGGAAVLLTGLVLPSDPVATREKDDAVADYNRRLRSQIGVSGALETAVRTARVSLALPPDGRAGLLVAGGSF